MGLAMLLLLVATALVGWQAHRLLAGRRSLNVAGLAVQLGIVMVAIAFATQNLAVGGFGIALACLVWAGWGGWPGQFADCSIAQLLPQSVQVAVNGPAQKSVSSRRGVGVADCHSDAGRAQRA